MLNNGFIAALKAFANKHANLVFGVLGVAGVAGTAVCASIATKNAMDILREHEGEYLTTKDKVKLVWPEYIWTGVVGLGTAGSIVASNIWSAKRAAGLSAALIIAKEQLDTTRAVFNDYRAEVQQYLPQDPEEQKKLQKIIDRRPKLEAGEYTKFINDKMGDILHIKETDTGIEYDCRLIDLDAGINKANAVINEQGFVSLNAFHEMIPNANIPYAEIGWDIGWDCTRDGLIGYTDPEAMVEEGPNGGAVVVVYICFTKCPSPKYR